jgi:hypothetical protein
LTDLFTWSADTSSAKSDRRGFAPPIKRRCAADAMRAPRLSSRPRRLHRTRRKNNRTPAGAVYVGRPTIWCNPFAGRAKVGHKRSVILYGAWLRGECTPRVLTAAGFSRAEIEELDRWRRRALARLTSLAGKDLQCWCPTTSEWCHADVLIDLANAAPHPAKD